MKQSKIALIGCLFLLTVGILLYATREKYTVIMEHTKMTQSDKVVAAKENYHYKLREERFMNIYSYPTDIVFLGDSITQNLEWNDVFPDMKVKNRGIGSDTTHGLLTRLDSIEKVKPKKVFIMIGINDLARGADSESIIENYILIVEYFKEHLHDTKLYIQSILPVSDPQKIYSEDIIILNNNIKVLCEDRHTQFIDLFPLFATSDNKLIADYTYDGIHLNPHGYSVWVEALKKYAYE